jgi:hypothetical protein
MVYFWKKNGMVYHHTELVAAAELDGLTTVPDMEASESAFEAADGIARLVNGEIVLGKTAAERQAEDAARQIIVLKKELAETDYIAAKIAEGSATVEEYADKIAQRQAWRQEIAELEATAW